MANLGTLPSPFFLSADCSQQIARTYYPGSIYLLQGPPITFSGCMPQSYNPTTSFYYSASQCPSGYTPACTEYVTVETLTDTRVTCCPTQQQFTCQTRPLYDFESTLGCSTNLPVNTYTLSTVTIVNNGATTVTPITASGGGINAYGVQLRYNAAATSSQTQSSTSSSSANPSSTSSPSSTPTATDAAASSSGLSSGAAAGIGIGCAVGGIAILAAVVFLFLRGRRRQQQQPQQPYQGGPPTAPGPMQQQQHHYQDQPPMSPNSMQQQHYQDQPPTAHSSMMQQQQPIGDSHAMKSAGVYRNSHASVSTYPQYSEQPVQEIGTTERHVQEMSG
ncbi:hypothetical protein PG997_014245 [Apiospora hydei]|uniref:Uncharacterized protein n=1 Tax=Apiospora hydei TaxID=1337664 RepID=A0ABR1UWF4_9PEZI